jgi:hypothetical protein
VIPHRCVARQSFRALNSLVRPFVKGGFGSPPPFGVGAVVVSTTGRRSGVDREVPLAAARLGDRVFVSTVRRNSDWMRNLEAEPETAVWLNGSRRSATADVWRRPGIAVLQLAAES